MVLDPSALDEVANYARRAHPAYGAENRDQVGGQEDILVVAMPSTPGGYLLPLARHEANLIGQHFPDRTRTLTGSGATYATVIEALAQARVAHFACHATSDPANPSASSLSLYDQQTARMHHRPGRRTSTAAGNAELPPVFEGRWQ